MPRLTLYGMYQYDNDLLETFTLPTGMDKSLLRDLIIENSGDLYPYYQVPDRLKTNINNWFKRMYSNFQKMYDALNADYNPIHNYDRYEQWTDSPNTTRTEQQSGTDTQTNTAGQGSVTQNSGTDESVNKISAYNSSTFDNDTSNSLTHGLKQTLTTNGSDTGKTDYGKKVVETNTGDTSHDGHLYGNIGVTTSQQMIESELELRLYDLYMVIADLFEKRFIIQVY